MGTDLPRNHDHTEKLLALAALLRKHASATPDPYEGDQMRRTAEGLEKAGARAETMLRRKMVETPVDVIDPRDHPLRRALQSRLSDNEDACQSGATITVANVSIYAHHTDRRQFKTQDNRMMGGIAGVGTSPTHLPSLLETVMKIDKQKKLKKPDLRRVEGSVLIKDTNENFVGKSPSAAESGPTPVSPGVVVPAAGQTTHE